GSETERLGEALPRAAGLDPGTQVETFERRAARLGADGVEELTPLPVPALLGGDLDVPPGSMGAQRGFGDRGSADGDGGDHAGDDGTDRGGIRGRAEQGPGHMTGRSVRIGEHLVQAQIVTVAQLSDGHVLGPWAVGNLIILAS